MKNWLIVLIVFVLPLGLYGVLRHRADAGMPQFMNPMQIQMSVEENNARNLREAALPKLYYFHSPLCSECKKQEKELTGLQDEFAGRICFIEHLVTGADGGKPEVKNLIKKYGVTVTPTIIIADADDKMIKKYDSAVKRSELQRFLKNVAANESAAPKRNK